MGGGVEVLVSVTLNVSETRSVAVGVGVGGGVIVAVTDELSAGVGEFDTVRLALVSDGVPTVDEWLASLVTDSPLRLPDGEIVSDADTPA